MHREEISVWAEWVRMVDMSGVAGAMAGVKTLEAKEGVHPLRLPNLNPYHHVQ
jgi:hypothetical protein